MPNVSFNYKQDTDRVFRQASDPDATKKRAEALGGSDVRIEVQEAGATKTVICTREVEAALPSFAKKLFKPRNLIVERKEWRDDGDRKTGHFHIDVKGTPVQIDGHITITPDGAGAVYEIDFDVTAKVPLIRKKLEEHIVGLTKEGMRDEFRYNQQQLNAAN